jgi:hypothetical protein
MPGLSSSSEDLAFMAQATTGDQADTPIMDILIGIAGSGRAGTGAIGRARRDEGPQPERRNFYRNFITSN